MKLTSFVASTYVRDLERSRVFYETLGFAEQSHGSNELSAWSYLRQDDHFILLVTSDPPTEIPELPLLFYFFVDDLGAAIAGFEAIGCVVEHVGYPPHALGGEVKTTDPDGNTILVGQPERSPSQPDHPEPAQHFSLLREAATLAQHRAGASMTCQLRDIHGEPCPRPAEVKLADSWGDTAWACIPHAEEALISAAGAFIADQDKQGLAVFMASRRKS